MLVGETHMKLTDLFDLSLAGRKDEVALEWQNEHLTFGEIDARSNRLAVLLRKHGLKAGDRLCVYLANRLEMIDLYLACVKLGVIFVPVNILYRERELTHILNDADPAAVVSDLAIQSGAPVWTADELTEEARTCENIRPSVALDGDTPAGIIYTSGTTGVSKGA